ncbi:hypothetical protein ACVWZ3_001660 [Bradyrhizobium sp. i1.3.6]
MSAPRLLDREHDRGEVLALVGVALVEHRGGTELFERGGQRLAAGGAKSVGRVQHGPLFLAERIDAVFGDDATGIAVIGAAAEQPLIAHVGEVRIGAADHHGLAKLDHVGRHRVHLGRTDRAEEPDDVGLRGELGESEHDAGIGGLVVLDDQLALLSQDTAGFVHSFERELGALDGVTAGFSGWTGDGRAHADLDGGALRMRALDEVWRGNAGSNSGREVASRQSHSFLPGAGHPCRPFLVLVLFWLYR